MTRRSRGRQAPPSTAPLTGQQATSAPIVVNLSKMTIGDLKLQAQLSVLNADGVSNEAALPMIPGIIDMLDRIVVGGVSHRPQSEFMAILSTVQTQMGRTQGN